MSSSWVIDFADLNRDDVEMVGGKGAQLGEMLGAGFAVPTGFCLTTEAYREIVGRKNDVIRELLPSGDLEWDVLQECGAAIRKLIMGISIPEDLEEEIMAAYDRLPGDEKVAVRSSATMEDSLDFSFAGQHDTYLNIGGEELLRHVKKSWASLWTDRAIAYRCKNSIDHFQISLAVVVQKMVSPCVAGVMFTVNPLTHQRETLINASWGLGEAIVSGKVSPDEYLVDGESFAIKDIVVSEKKLMMELGDRGVVEKPVGEDKQGERCLSDKQIQELARVGQKIEKHYQGPQDIEWAVAGDEIFILQSRPITTLNKPLKNMLTLWGNKTTGDLLKDKIVYWSNWNVRETLPYPLTHFSWSAFNDGFFPHLFKKFFGLKKTSKLYPCNHIIDLVYGRIYWNMNMVYGHPLMGPFASAGIDQIDAQAGRTFRKLHKEKKLQPVKFGWSFSLLFFAFYNAAKIGLSFFLVPWVWTKEKMRQRCEVYWDKACQFESLKLEGKSNVELLEAVDDFFQYSSNYWASSFLLLGYGSFSYDVLVFLTRKWPDITPTKLVAGLPGNKTTQGALELYKLSEMPESIKQVFLDSPLEDILPILEKREKSEDGKEFRKRLNTFLEYYGHRGAKEFDIAQPRWKDDSSFVLQMIKNYLQLDKNDVTPVEHFAKMAEEGEQLVAVIRSRFSRILPLRKWIFNRFLKHTQLYIPFRENPKYYVLKCFSGAKRIVLELGHRLDQENQLEEARDILFFTLPEMDKVVKGTFADQENLKSIIAQRKKEWQENLEIEPPFIVRSDGVGVIVDEDEQKAGVLRGTPVSSGKIEGIARIILDPQDGSAFNKGEILVAPFTDPGWTPLFLTAKAFIMEVGGVMSHGAIVAREYGIPAVVGVKDATKIIKTGDKITVDGHTGEVILEDVPLEKS